MAVGKKTTPMKKSPLKLAPLAVIALGSLAAGVVSAGVNAYSNYRAGKRQEDFLEEESEIADANYKQARKDLLGLEFKNPYENIETKFENTFEDLTVNQKQAEFEARQAAQSRTNILANLRGAAGSSGVAGLAQAMANQATVQNARAAASIGQQEAVNQRLAARGAAAVQDAETAAKNKIAYGEYLKQQDEIQRSRDLIALRSGQQMAQQQFRTGQMEAEGQQESAVIGGVGSLLAAGAQVGVYAAGGMFNEDFGKPDPTNPSQKVVNTNTSDGTQAGKDAADAAKRAFQGVDTSQAQGTDAAYAQKYANLDIEALINKRVEMEGAGLWNPGGGGDSAYIQNKINEMMNDPTRYEL